jgi:DNA-binding response OmpR family regulator/putative methionine-R-sulfoxide reductase with GAF domain
VDSDGKDVVLVIEGEDATRHLLHDMLEGRGFDVVTARSAEDGCALLEQRTPAMALLDTVPRDMSGIDLLEKIRTSAPDAEIVMLTSRATVEMALAAIRKGAFDFLLKPLEDPARVLITVDRALERRSLTLRNRALLDELGQQQRELSSAVTRLSSLIEAGRTMGEFLALGDLLDFFIALVAKELNVERASLMLVDRDSMQLRIAASRGLDSVDPAEVRVGLGEGVAGSVAETGRACLVQDADRLSGGPGPNPGLSGSFMSAPILLSVPIKACEQVLGVINVTNRRSGEPFDEDDLHYLSGLAGQLAVAVDRASRFEETAKTHAPPEENRAQRVGSGRIEAVGPRAAGVANDLAEVARDRGEAVSSNAPGMQARILLIQENAAVRDTYVDALALHGHEVVALSNGDRAAELFPRESFDLVVTDLSLSGVSGLEIARHVKTVNPAARVILIGDGSARPEHAETLAAGVDYALARPCLVEDLLATVQAALRPRVGVPQTSSV